MDQFIRLGTTAEDTNLKSNIFFARERFNLALKALSLYGFSLGRILPDESETEAHSSRRDCASLEKA